MAFKQRSFNMRKRYAVLSLFAALSLSAPSFGDGGHGHGPRHGGVAREVGKLTYELVAKPETMTLHVSDHGKPVSTRGANAQATVYAGDDKTTVTLTPAGENQMTAKGNFKTGVGVRVALSIALAGQKEQRITFNLK
jgi:hypothetical protein